MNSLHNYNKTKQKPNSLKQIMYEGFVINV